MRASEYQEWTGSMAVYPEGNTGSIQALTYVVMALGGEVGEIQNAFKKVLRGDPGKTDDDGNLLSDVRDHLRGELQGVIYYVARLADELGLDLEQEFDESFDLLMDRQARGVIKGSGDNR